MLIAKPKINREKLQKHAKTATKPKKPAKSARQNRTVFPEAYLADLRAAVDYQTEDTTLVWDEMEPGPWQNRTVFPEAYLADLQASIEAHGVRTRVWVRPKDQPAKKGAQFDIIAGECRWRAGRKTRHLVCPVTIYHVTPAQAKVLSILENLQRENLNAMDEAMGFRKLQDEGWSAWDPEHPERSIGHKVGKSKTYTYAALKLTELDKTGQQAVRAGELSASVAVRIARIPNAAARKEAQLQAIARGWTDDRAADEITRRYMTELKGAPFDRKDATLNPARGTCDKCPFLSGNQAEMYPDMAKGRADICTDPACFRGKCEAAFSRRAKEHEAKGGRVLTKAEAVKAGLRETYSSVGGEFTELDDACYFVPSGTPAYGKKLRVLLKNELKSGALLPDLALANDGSGKHYELLDKGIAEQALRNAGLLKRAKGSETSPQKDYEREAKERKQRENGIIRWQLGRIAATAKTAVYTSFSISRVFIEWLIAERGKDICRHIVESRGLEVKAFKIENDPPGERIARCLRAHAEALPPEDLVPLILELLCAPAWTREGELGERAEPVLAMLKLDPEVLFEEALGAIPGGEKILAERKQLTLLTEPIVELLQSATDGASEDELWERLEKDTRVMKQMEDYEAIEGLDDWWRAVGRRDGRVVKEGSDRYRLKAAAPKPEEVQI